MSKYSTQLLEEGKSVDDIVGTPDSSINEQNLAEIRKSLRSVQSGLRRASVDVHSADFVTTLELLVEAVELGDRRKFRDEMKDLDNFGTELMDILDRRE